jgi:hypothetical protein
LSSPSSTTTVSPPATSGQSAKSTNEAPIIGGAVAGAAIVGITALGIAFIFFRRRRQYGPPPAELSAQSGAPPQRMQQYESPNGYYGPEGDRDSDVGQSPPSHFAQTSPGQHADQQASAVSNGSGTVHAYQHGMPTIPQSPAEMDATPASQNARTHPPWSPDS